MNHPTPKRRALVLSGGSIKGAFQVGAIQELLNRGFAPDIVYGISVGALNGAYIANEAGRAKLEGRDPDWPEIGKLLVNYWLTNITEPDDIVKQRSLIGSVWGALTNDFEGLFDTSPLTHKVREVLVKKQLRESPVSLSVGVVNMATGDLELADPSYPDFEEYVIASTSIPVLMPVRVLDGQPFTDGGVRDVAMLGRAIDEGADEIVVILCQPEKVSGIEFDAGNLVQFMTRLMNIVVNEIVNNDIARAKKVNQFAEEYGSPVPDGPFQGKRLVKVTVIRPAKEPAIELDDFDTQQIRDAIENGIHRARLVLDEKG